MPVPARRGVLLRRPQPHPLHTKGRSQPHAPHAIGRPQPQVLHAQGRQSHVEGRPQTPHACHCRTAPRSLSIWRHVQMPLGSRARSGPTRMKPRCCHVTLLQSVGEASVEMRALAFHISLFEQPHSRLACLQGRAGYIKQGRVLAQKWCAGKESFVPNACLAYLGWPTQRSLWRLAHANCAKHLHDHAKVCTTPIVHVYLCA